jgi:putative flippase GtrA
MGNSNERNSTTRKVVLSVLAAIVGFFAGVILSGFLIYIFFSTFGTFSETGPLMVMFLSPIIGVITAIISGVKIYKRMSG